MTAQGYPVAPRRMSGPGEFAWSVATILSKELRGRFRGRRAFVVLTIYLAILALIAYGAYTVEAPSARDAALGASGAEGIPGGASLANASASIGQAIFSMLSVFQLLLVAFIAPAFTAGAISLEREKQTLDLLITTPMRPGAIVVGKLLAALAFVFLMILAAVPVSALVLMYGGATVDDILRQQLILFASAIGFGVIGVFFSALVRRTQAATVLTYSSMLLLVIGTLLVWRFWTEVATNDPDNAFGQIRRAPEQILWLNPAVAMIEVVANTELTYGEFTDAIQSIRGDAYVPANIPGSGSGTGSGAGLATDLPACPPDARCAKPDPEPGTDIGVETAAPELVSSHFLSRFVAAFGGLSLVLTLAAMALVVPAGMRGIPRRRRPTVTRAADGEPAVVEMDR
jgi:ABC-type transport system involved in multi-copper enzyme maturation permease subunit